jgi:solute carrier family 35 protein F1/2
MSCDRARWWAIVLGQLISFFVAGTGVFSTVLSNAGIDIPTSQSSINYVLLLIYLGFRFRAVGWSKTWQLKVPWWRYGLLALVDVEANYLVVKAYRYTSITSIMLIDCWTIPCVMAMSYFFLRRRFLWRHIVGVGLCIAGLSVLVVSDWLQAAPTPADTPSGAGGGGNHTARMLAGGLESPGAWWLLPDGSPASSQAGPRRLAADVPSSNVIGDLLCFAGATLYAISNVGQEALVKSYDRTEFLAMLGVFGSVINGVQLLALERGELAAIAWTPATAGCVLGFALFLFAMYTLTSFFLQGSDSTLFNLSLLTSDLWAILAAVFFFDADLHPLYFLALALIVVGLLLYNTAPDAPSPHVGVELHDAAEAPAAAVEPRSGAALQPADPCAWGIAESGFQERDTLEGTVNPAAGDKGSITVAISKDGSGYAASALPSRVLLPSHGSGIDDAGLLQTHTSWR